MQTTSQTRSVVLLAALMIAATASARAAAEGEASTEQELLAVLRSDAPKADKAIACKKLAIHGSSAAVPDLAKLLPDEQLASWGRIALEAIPGAAADEALRKATETLQGKLLVGTINSIGVRKDSHAVVLLSLRLRDDDFQVAAAAAAALGRIGNADATKSLRQALTSVPLKVRDAVAEGCVLCAERHLSEGRSSAAVELYDQVRQADVPKQRIVEATRGAILARKDEGIPLLLEQFRSTDKVMFQVALGTAREFPGGQVDKALAAELEHATPQRAALIIQCMADREKTVVLEAVLQAAQRGPKEVRLSAIDALQRVGDASCLSGLLEIAVDADTDLAPAAKETLASLKGEEVNTHIASLLPGAAGKSYPLLIELVGQRHIDAVPDLLEALEHSNQAVRTAALFALGETVAPRQLSVLVSQVVAPKHAGDAAAAQQALRAASIRMPDRDACAAELATALERSPAATKSALLEILGEVGGKKALQALAAAAKSDEPELQDTASRLLGSGNSVDAAPFLLDLAKAAPADKYRLRALRGYIGLAWKFAMPEDRRVEMCQNALDLSRRLDEQKLVLNVLTRHPSTEALKLAIKMISGPALKDESTAAALAIAKKLGSPDADLKGLLSGAGLSTVKLEIVKAEYGAGATQRDVTAVLRKQAGDLPLIVLKSTTYNASFGGDPSPGTPKQLKIQYRINGKAGTASFKENSLIILPIPK